MRALLARMIFWAIEPELKRREREALRLVINAMDDVGKGRIGGSTVGVGRSQARY